MNKLKLIHSTDEGKVYECPICHGEVVVHEGVFFGKCKACSATVIDYYPAPHQMKFHQSPAIYRLNVGGFGSGKTTMCCAEIARHVLSVPNGATLITAQKLQQVEEAVIPELLRFIPPWLMRGRPKNKPNFSITLKNNHKIMVFASDDEQKLRSLNLTAFYIEEASGVDKSVFVQLQARLRNKAGEIKDKDGRVTGYNYMGILSSNPDDCWWREDFLLMSGKIFTSASIDRTVYDNIRATEGEEAYHSFISSTRDNVYLPKIFISKLCVGKSRAWIRKYIDCYLDQKEGSVYPEFNNCLVAPFKIPDHWLRVAGFDKGWADPTALLLGAIDPVNAIVYWYDEYYVSQMPITHHAREIRKMVHGYKFYQNIQADPSVRNKNDRDGSTYQEHFQSICGIYLEPANNDINFGIEKVRDYLFSGRMKFFTTLENTKKEMSLYRYTERKGDGTISDKPMDRHNHLMDCLRYATVKLPLNPSDLISVSKAKEGVNETQGVGEVVNDEGVHTMDSNIYFTKGW